MREPHWDRLEEWARCEASAYLDVGLPPHPTVLFFEGDQPTLYVRGGVAYAGPAATDQTLRWNELFGFGMVVQPERVALLAPIRLRTDDGGALAGEAEGECALLVGWARRQDAAAPEQGSTLLTYGLDDDGRPRWGERQELPDGGPLAPHLAATVTGRWGADGAVTPSQARGPSPVGIAYAMARFGLSIGVHPAWCSHYGLDQPIPPHEVRAEDRRRARRLQQAAAGARP